MGARAVCVCGGESVCLEEVGGVGNVKEASSGRRFGCVLSLGVLFPPAFYTEEFQAYRKVERIPDDHL